MSLQFEDAYLNQKVAPIQKKSLFKFEEAFFNLGENYLNKVKTPL